MTSRGRPVVVVGLLVMAAAGRELPSLVEIPSPPLSQLEAPAAAQVEELQGAWQEAVTGSEPDPAELAGLAGRLGQLYLLYDFGDAAAAAFENAARLVPADHRPRYYLGVLAQRAGDFEVALARLEEVLALEPGHLPSLLRRGEILLLLDEPEAAEAIFRRALTQRPGLAFARFGLGRIALSQGDAAAARDHFLAVLERQPWATTVHHPLGLAFRALNDLDAARGHLSRRGSEPVAFPDPLIEDLPALAESPRIHVTRGNDARRKGFTRQAVRAYRRALAIDPDHLTARFNLGTTLAEAGALEEAVTELERAVEVDPAHRDARFNLATALAGTGRYREAAEEFSRLLTLHPDDLEARVHRAAALFAAGDSAAAEAEVEAVRGEPTAAMEALLALGDLERSRGRGAAATERYREALERAGSPAEQARAEARLGELAAAEGRIEEAIEWLGSAVGRSPADPDLRYRLGNLLGRAGQLEEAAGEMARVVRAEPERLDAHFGRVNALLLAGRFPEAQTALEEASALLPHRTELRLALAELLATCPDPGVRDGERALELARASYRERGGAAAASTVAMALAELERFDEAVSWQERAVATAREAGAPAEEVATLSSRLAELRQGRPVRSPWKEGG